MSMAAVSLGLSAILARVLSPAELGAYFLVLNVVMVGGRVGLLGMDNALVQLVASAIGTGGTGEARTATTRCFFWGMLGSVIAACLVFGVGSVFRSSFFHQGAGTWILGLAALWLIANAVQMLLGQGFLAFHDVRNAAMFGGLLANALLVTLIPLLKQFGKSVGLLQVIGLSILTYAATAVVGGWILRARVRKLGKPSSGPSDADVLRMGWPVLVVNLAYSVLSQSDLWIIGAFRGAHEVALYGAAARLAFFVTTPLMIILAFVPPLIAELYAQGRTTELEKTLRGLATVAAVPAVGCLLLFVLFGRQILDHVYGGFYAESATVLVLLATGQCVNVCAGSCGMALMMTKHQRTMMTVTLVCGVVALITMLCLVNRYGATGVAAAVAFGMILQNVASTVAAKIKTGMWTHLDLAQPLTLWQGWRAQVD